MDTLRRLSNCPLVFLTALTALYLGLTAAGTRTAAAGSPPQIKSDEHVMFFPTAGCLSDDGREWVFPVEGWIFEPERQDQLRGAILERLVRTLRLPPDQEITDTFRQRMALFLVDDERHKEIGIRLGDVEVSLPLSDADGHFSGEVRLAVAQAEVLATQGWLSYQAVTAAGDVREFPGQVQLVPPQGLSVISDIDDTIKITEVTSPTRLIQNLFFEPFRAVPGMSELYRRWSDEGAVFHYVSASPWQLYEPLSALCADERFPRATWHLRRVRLTDPGQVQKLSDSRGHKRDAITRLLRQFPRRRFVLVGDSGESDPEVYGEIARQFPEQVQRIYIRDVTGEPVDAARFTAALHAIPRDHWQVFTDPATLRLPPTD